MSSDQNSSSKDMLVRCPEIVTDLLRSIWIFETYLERRTCGGVAKNRVIAWSLWILYDAMCIK
ncbi:MAG: hypothetical protein CFH41_01938 [Alphaproteobacteria bacterium MarineAlpha11_Bin1]|nr:MAG: hypothetical protein CFH41_01938 [Alphaproteobacteria bacterium MarineAlpha11_Bin1]